VQTDEGTRPGRKLSGKTAAFGALVGVRLSEPVLTGVAGMKAQKRAAGIALYMG